MILSSQKRNTMKFRVALIGRVSSGKAQKRAASPDDFSSEWQALSIAPERSKEG